MQNRQKANDKLKHHRGKQGEYYPGWQETFDSALDIIALISKDFKILRINKAGYENLGKRPEELIGKECYVVVHGLKSPIAGCPCKESLKTKTKGEGEIRDHGRCYIATASPILDASKKPIAFAHTIKDISELKATAEKLRESKEMLETRVQERTLELLKSNKRLKQEIKERIRAEMILRKSDSILRKHESELNQKNMALQEMISQVEINKRKMKEDIKANLEKAIFPVLERMKEKKDKERYVELLLHHLNDLASSYGIDLAKASSKLTSREIEICNMVKAYFSSKEIANILDISCQTVGWHRKRIRQKLGLAHRGISLSTYLHRT